MKVTGLFTDYDGTLAPTDVRREDSGVPGPLLSAISQVSSGIPVAIVTSKDLKFVKQRTPFAWAWAAVLGLEVRLRDGSGRLAQVSEDFRQILVGVRKALPSDIVVEEKLGSDGSLLGVALDWTLASDSPPPELKEAESAFETGGFQITKYTGERYTDIYAAPIDKGVGVRELVDLLGVEGPVMYLGDSEADNEAFEACEIPICVVHSQKTDHLNCDFAVRPEELPGFLTALVSSGFEFEGALARVSGVTKTR